MNSAERVRKALTHQEPDRVPSIDSFWDSTLARWKQEGMPSDAMPEDYFNLDMMRIRPDLTPRFAVDVVEEDAEYILERTPYGGLRRQHRDHSSTPEILDWAIKDRADWERIKPLLTPDADRIDWEEARTTYADARAKGKFVAYFAHVGYAHFQEYIKTDDLLMILLTDPDWAIDMFATQAELVVGLAQRMLEGGIEFDGAFIACDLGYRNGTLFSPETYRKLQFPFDKQVFGFFRDQDKPAILHSDGCVKALIPYFIEAGVACLHPVETKAGMDLIELKREYGKDMAFCGGIDVRAMSDPNPAVIEEEIRRKLEVAKVGGGYIYHSDHSVPNDVSLDQYRRVQELVQKYGQY